VLGGSTTKTGIVRGNHFHTKRIERFCIVKGTAQISMRRVGTNQIISYIINDTDNIVDKDENEEKEDDTRA
jgi:UDP-2-acetamido-2,6-beta-L-arabino-hexul-4-ose reductase